MSPFQISVIDVSRRIGEERNKEVEFEVAERMGEGVAFVPKGTKMSLAVRLEGLHDGILVTGEVETEAVGECVRCLDEVRIPLQVDFSELFGYSPTEELEFSVHDNHVNCEPLVRDAVVLELPFQPLCDEDCLGLDPDSGKKLMEPRAETEPIIDSRWSALEALVSPVSKQGKNPAQKKRK